MIGDDSTVRGFAAAGVVGFPATESAEALKTLEGLARSGDYAILFVTESLAESILPEISRMSAIRTGEAASAIPAIVVIPDQGGSRGIGFEKIRGAVEKALGIDILGKEAERDNR